MATRFEVGDLVMMVNCPHHCAEYMLGHVYSVKRIGGTPGGYWFVLRGLWYASGLYFR